MDVCLPLIQVPVSALILFVDSLEMGYSKHRNPYHNLTHAADVTQTIHYLLLKTGLLVGLNTCVHTHARAHLLTLTGLGLTPRAAGGAPAAALPVCPSSFQHWLTELEIFATIFAAAIHDYEHTGTTNNFHIQTRCSCRCPG